MQHLLSHRQPPTCNAFAFKYTAHRAVTLRSCLNPPPFSANVHARPCSPHSSLKMWNGGCRVLEPRNSTHHLLQPTFRKCTTSDVEEQRVAAAVVARLRRRRRRRREEQQRQEAEDHHNDGRWGGGSDNRADIGKITTPQRTGAAAAPHGET